MQSRFENENGDVKQTQQKERAGNHNRPIVIGRGGKNGDYHRSGASVFDDIGSAFVGSFFRKPDEKHGNSETEKKHPGDSPGAGAVDHLIHGFLVDQVAQVVVFPVETDSVFVLLRASRILRHGDEQQRQRHYNPDYDSVFFEHFLPNILSKCRLDSKRINPLFFQKTQHPVGIRTANGVSKKNSRLSQLQIHTA